MRNGFKSLKSSTQTITTILLTIMCFYIYYFIFCLCTNIH